MIENTSDVIEKDIPGDEDIKENENAEATDAEAAESASVEDADGGKLKGADKKRLKKAEAELADTQKALDALQGELKEEKEKYLRMLAEYDNFRRRTAKEKDSIYADAVSDTVMELLPVIDNLERAAQSTTGLDGADAVTKGVAMTLKSALDALAKLGVSEVETKTFNPDIHNAVMHVEDESLEEGQIVEVFQKGYVRGDKVIRYAMVKVAN